MFTEKKTDSLLLNKLQRKAQRMLSNFDARGILHSLGKSGQEESDQKRQAID